MQKHAIKKFCVKEEIAVEFTVLETSEQNGVSERFDRTVVEADRCLLLDSKLPNAVVKQKHNVDLQKKILVQNR